MTGTEWAIGAFGSSAQAERRQFLDAIVAEAFGKAQDVIAARQSPPGAYPGEKGLPGAQEAPGATSGPAGDQEG